MLPYFHVMHSLVMPDPCEVTWQWELFYGSMHSETGNYILKSFFKSRDNIQKDMGHSSKFRLFKPPQ